MTDTTTDTGEVMVTESPSVEDVSEEIPLPLSSEENRVPTIPQLCVALGILGLVLGSPTLVHYVSEATQRASAPALEQARVPEHAPSFLADNAFDSTRIEATSAYVWDVAQQRALYTKNASAQLPLASLTKLMTGLVAYEAYGKDTIVPITLTAIKQEGESGLRQGDEWSAQELLEYTLMTSSNDGAYALAGSVGLALRAEEAISPENAFINLMNTKAEELGLSNTYFTNSTGLDTSTAQSGSYGSARDMAFLMEHIIKNTPDLLLHTKKTTAVFHDTAGNTFSATNTNQHIANILNPLGSKTGYTDLAGGNLVVAFNIGLNHPIIISVLGSSREGRFTDVEALVQTVTRAYRSTTP